VGDHATFLGWVYGEALARAYASADVFLFASETDTFGQVILEAQASGLPVVAVDRGGPASLIEHSKSGLLAQPDAPTLADSVVSLVRDRALRERVRRGGLASARDHTWDAALDRLSAGYRMTLERTFATRGRDAA
jgi:glycosyltransferase involved in cell wall biosynthesis